MFRMARKLLHGLGLASYRAAAKLIALCLARHEFVEGIYIHRSVATGEVSFGESDIDLLLVLKSPEQGAAMGGAMLRLFQDVTRLLRLHPALLHVQIHDRQGLARWIRTDSYRGWMECHTARLAAGRASELRPPRLRRRDALRWFAFNPALFLSTAARLGSGRDQLKIATEMWSACEFYRGCIEKPDLTRSQALRRALDKGEPAGLLRAMGCTSESLGFIAGLAKPLHNELLPPLAPLGEPLVFLAPMPPRDLERCFVLLPEDRFRPAGIPVNALAPGAILATAELLHLYIKYVQPFSYWYLQPRLAELGMVPPDPEDFVFSCLFFLQDNLLRTAGFTHRDPWAPAAMVAVVEYALPYLEDGLRPPVPSERQLFAFFEGPGSIHELYAHHFERIYWQSRRQLERLEHIAARMSSGAQPAEA